MNRKTQIKISKLYLNLHLPTFNDVMPIVEELRKNGYEFSMYSIYSENTWGCLIRDVANDKFPILEHAEKLEMAVCKALEKVIKQS